MDLASSFQQRIVAPSFQQRIVAPCSLPLGESLPPGEPHAVSVSLPTWKSVVSWSYREAWVIEAMKGGYPRLFVNRIIEALAADILKQWGLTEMKCSVFPSAASAERCQRFLKRTFPETETIIVTASCPGETPSQFPLEYSRWLEFSAVIYPERMSKAALSFWRETGDGISSRQAEFCHNYLQSLSLHMTSAKNIVSRTLPHGTCLSSLSGLPSPDYQNASTEKLALATFIAKLATSDQGPPLAPKDIFLYQKGLSAIFSVGRALKMGLDSDAAAVIYGWPYSETTKCVSLHCGFEDFTIYGHGSAVELDEIEAKLLSGKQIRAVFCELPSNPQLASPDLQRIKRLSDQYGFVVVCDETLGTFVNVDVLPYSDVVITSLTKIFSGGSNVMGGSVIINPTSRHYDDLHAKLTQKYEDSYFPEDIKILLRNCSSFVSRVRQSTRSARLIADVLNGHASVKQIYYPSLVPSKEFYDRCMRPDGGYGTLLSVIFHDAEDAVRFYDNVDVAKGPSLGNDFTMCLPYALVSHFGQYEWAASYGVVKHIVRISVGLEDTDLLVRIFEKGLTFTEHGSVGIDCSQNEPILDGSLQKCSVQNKLMPGELSGSSDTPKEALLDVQPLDDDLTQSLATEISEEGHSLEGLHYSTEKMPSKINEGNSYRRFYLITHPRSASHLLVHMLNLEAQADVQFDIKSGYFFYPTHLMQRELGTFEKPIDQWTCDERSKVQASQQDCANELFKHLQAADASGKIVFTKEHSMLLREIVMGSREVFECTNTAETPWIVRMDGVQDTDSTEVGVPPVMSTPRNETMFSENFLATWRPIFLIRHPALAFPSMARARIDLVGLEAAAEAQGEIFLNMTLHWSRAIYEWYAARADSNDAWPIVIDADQLISNPEILIHLCELTGLDATKVRFEWSSAAPKYMEEFPTETEIRMMSTIKTSRGIQHDKLAGNLDVDVEAKKWKAEFGDKLGTNVEDYVRRAMPDFEFLKSKKIEFPTGMCGQ